MGCIGRRSTTCARLASSLNCGTTQTWSKFFPPSRSSKCFSRWIARLITHTGGRKRDLVRHGVLARRHSARGKLAVGRTVKCLSMSSRRPNHIASATSTLPTWRVRSSLSHSFEVNTLLTRGKVLTALTYLHARKYAHRDLKSQNIMMDVTGKIKLSMIRL